MGRINSVLRSAGLTMLLVAVAAAALVERSGAATRRRYAYATMMYMGTPRDYEFYVATRVLIRSLAKLKVDADLIVIASKDVPLRWVHALGEDGAKVKRVDSLNNPYKNQKNFDLRFKLSLNKLYAWSLVEYDRVVMLDADNLFLRKTDELFQCGQFCAVFINPCIFHTGLFVLQPSMKLFNGMAHQLKIGRENPDGADQGFICGYFPNLLDRPMFHPPSNGSRLVGHFRLPLGYQMDASYYYLKLRWNIPCGPNSVITFPSAPWLKPWYWYGAEVPSAVIQSVFYLAMIAMTRLARPNFSKLCYQRSADKNTSLVQASLKTVALLSMLTSYIIPFFVVPHTIHPIAGWGLYLLGSFAFSSIAINAFMLPASSVLVPWAGILGVLVVMAYPLYTDGVVRALAVFSYAFCCAPVVWSALVRVLASLQLSLEREAFLPRIGESSPDSGFNKLY
ncbi:hypothetical protein SAY87_012851 [Trapa incisa]|uniref:Glucuronosyltransferase PGSIP8 n=1 Tax=Trapa incisa TaxID=236973 RepID=A0AAN7GQR4_9MYRT|nr:hypothetical protein SAY87_012851 [Trapa incisa]